MKRILPFLLLIPWVAFGQQRDSVMVDTNGIVKFPANFFGLNASSNASALNPYFQALDADLTRIAAISGAAGAILYRDATGWTNLPVGSNGQFLSVASSLPAWVAAPSVGGGGTGSVTNVGLSLPAIFNVSGSPVTTGGTLAGTFANATSNTFLAGPVSGSAAAPTMRTLRENDLASITNLVVPEITTTLLSATAIDVPTNTVDEIILNGGLTWNGIRYTNFPAGGGGGGSLTVQSNSVVTNINNSFAISGLVTAGSVKLLDTAPVTLTDAATIATDASLSKTFIVTLGGNRTLGAPTNPTHGQRALWVAIQDSTGGRSLIADTGAGGFQPTLTVTLPSGDFGITTNAGKASFISAIYLTNTAKWHALGVSPGL